MRPISLLTREELEILRAKGEELRTIKMDIFEPIEIQNELTKLGIPVQREKLPTDFEIGDVGLERKSIGDFFNSLREGRIFDQVKRLCDIYPRKALIIEGSITPKLAMRFKKMKGNLDSKIRFLKHRLEGFKTGMFLGFYLPIFETSNHEDTAWLLANLHTKITEKKPFERPIPIIKSNLTPEQIREEMIACVNRIGRKGSKRLIQTFSTIEALCKADREALLKIGLNRKQIYNLLLVLKDEEDLSLLPGGTKEGLSKKVL